MVGDTLGNYTIVRPLGRGAMGEVFVAQHTLLKHEVAIKLLKRELSTDGELVQRFFNEAIAATRIRHPGIVQVLDFGRKDGAAFCVMELLDGEPLSARIRKRGRLPSNEAARFAAEVASALAAAHKQDIVHRDLKPDNIFLTSDGEGGERAKVLDFGIAKLGASTEHAAPVATHEGSILGTPLYMSPEQCRGQADVDARADVYSLGCVLFEMLTGKPPFPGASVGEVLGAHQHLAPPALRSVASSAPAAVEALVARMLAKSASDRPQTMREVVEVLRPIGGGVASSGDQAVAATVASSDGALAATAAPLAVATSTLGGAAAQATSPMRQRGRRALIAGAAVALLAGAAVVVVLRARPAATVSVLREPLVVTPMPAPAKVHTLPTIVADPARPSRETPAKFHTEIINGKKVIVIDTVFHHFGKLEKPSVTYIVGFPPMDVDPASRTMIYRRGEAGTRASLRLDVLREPFVAAEREVTEASRGFSTALADVRRRYVGMTEQGEHGLVRSAREEEVERVRSEWEPRLAAARIAIGKATIEMMALLEGAFADLTPDGLLMLALLYRRVALQDADERQNTATDVVVPDFSKALNIVELAIARTDARDHLAEALFLKGTMLAELFPTPERLSEVSRQFWRVVYEFPESPLARDANLRAGDLLFEGGSDEELERAATAFRWLSEVDGVPPSQRAHALYKLGWTASRLGRRRDAVAAFCELMAMPRTEFARETTQMLAIAMFEAEHSDAPTQVEDLMTPACKTQTCPCVGPVLAETALIYQAQGLPAAADELFKRLRDESPPGIYQPVGYCGAAAMLDKAGRKREAAELRQEALQRFAPGSEWTRAHQDVVRRLADPEALMRCEKVESFMPAALDSYLPRAIDTGVSSHQPAKPAATSVGRDPLEKASFGALPIFRACQRTARDRGRDAVGPYRVSFRVMPDERAATVVVAPDTDAELSDCLRSTIDRVRWAGLAKRNVRLDLVFRAP